MELLNWKLLIACFLLGGCLTAFIMLLFFENEHLKKISLSKNNRLYFIMAITIVVSIHFNIFYYICLLQLS